MIERLLVAERALADGDLERAERLFEQVAEADERNAIAVVGLAEVALARGDREAVLALAARALAIDPDEAAATRLLTMAAQPQAAEPSPSTEHEPAARRSLVGRLRAWLRRLGRGA